MMLSFAFPLALLACAAEPAPAEKPKALEQLAAEAPPESWYPSVAVEGRAVEEQAPPGGAMPAGWFSWNGAYSRYASWAAAKPDAKDLDGTWKLLARTYAYSRAKPENRAEPGIYDPDGIKWDGKPQLLEFKNAGTAGRSVNLGIKNTSFPDRDFTLGFADRADANELEFHLKGPREDAQYKFLCRCVGPRRMVCWEAWHDDAFLYFKKQT